MASGSGGDHRRKWDNEEFERLARERIRLESETADKLKSRQPPVRRDFLRQRDYKVDLDSKLGKSIVITKNTPSSQTGGSSGGNHVMKDDVPPSQ